MVISKSIPPTFLGRKKTTSQSRNKKKLRVIKNFLLCLYCEEVSEKAIVSMTLPEQQQHASSHSPYISRIVQGGSGVNGASHYPFRPGSPNFAALFSNGVTRYAHSMVFFILIEGPRWVWNVKDQFWCLLSKLLCEWVYLWLKQQRRLLSTASFTQKPLFG